MDRTRKSLLILGAIALAEAVPLAMMVAGGRPGVVGRLWGWQGGALAWVAAAAVTAAYVVHGVRALPLVRQRFFEVSALKLTALPFALVTGAFEELFFRKMLMDWGAHQGAGAAAQIALSAAVFGVAHAVWGLFGRNWRVALGAAAATGLLGALLGGVYLLAGRQLAPCIWAHTLINLALEPWMVLAAVSAAEKGWASRQNV